MYIYISGTKEQRLDMQWGWSLEATGKGGGGGNIRGVFFYLGFLSRTFTIYRRAGEGGGYFFNSSLQPPPASQTLRL